MARESTFRVLVAGSQDLQEVYQRLYLREGLPVELRPNRDEYAIHVESRKGFASLGKSEYLGYLLGSEGLIFHLDRGYKIKNPQFAGYHDEDWGKELILQITVEKPTADDGVPIVGCPHCRSLNVKTDLNCRDCRKNL